MISADQLPFGARQRWRALSDAESELQAAVALTVRRISELSNAVDLGSTEEAANLEHEITRLRGKLSEQQARHQHMSSISAALRHWLSTVSPNAILEDAKAPKVRLKVGESQTQAIKRLRQEIVELQGERRRVKGASPSIPEMKAAAARHVAALVERGRPKLVIEHDRFAMSFEADRWEDKKVTAECIVAWVAPEQILAALERQIDALPVTGISLTAEARAERLSSIGASIGIKEREEEALITELELGEGPLVPRRIDADPKVLLGIVVKKATAKAKAA